MDWVRILWETIYIAVYWGIGGYALSWFFPNPWPMRVATICFAFGSTVYVITSQIEDMQFKAPPVLSCLMFAPPMTMMLAGLITWAMALLGIIEPFR